MQHFPLSSRLSIDKIHSKPPLPLTILLSSLRFWETRDQLVPGSLFSRSGGRGERDPGNEVVSTVAKPFAANCHIVQNLPWKLPLPQSKVKQFQPVNLKVSLFKLSSAQPANQCRKFLFVTVCCKGATHYLLFFEVLQDSVHVELSCIYHLFYIWCRCRALSRILNNTCQYYILCCWYIFTPGEVNFN